jgi:DNA ligase-1
VLKRPDYLEGIGDSLDLVPIGAWWGQGRKAGWWSPILLACHNPETGALEAVCKCECKRRAFRQGRARRA